MFTLKDLKYLSTPISVSARYSDEYKRVRSASLDEIAAGHFDRRIADRIIEWITEMWPSVEVDDNGLPDAVNAAYKTAVNCMCSSIKETTLSKLKPSQFDPQLWGCPRCGFPLFPKDSIDFVSIPCACGVHVVVDTPQVDSSITWKQAISESEETMIIINFSHPLTPTQVSQIETLLGQPPAEIRHIPAHFDAAQPFVPQIDALVNACGLTATEWQTTPLLVVPPALNFIALILLAELHGRIGHFVPVVRIRPVTNNFPLCYEVAEIINLQRVRSHARTKRN